MKVLFARLRLRSPRYFKRSYMWCVVKALVAMLFIFSVYVTVTHYSFLRVSNTSMSGTIDLGSFVVIDKSEVGFREPISGISLSPNVNVQKGDVVTYRAKVGGRVRLLVGRIVALEGDVVSLSERILSVNGVQQTQSGIMSRSQGGEFMTEVSGQEQYRVQYSPSRDGTSAAYVRGGEWTVADDSVFIMGDARDVSYDSRWSGSVANSDLHGHVIMVY
ncbi:Signal peptidase I [Vibrio chagasii]|nr:Signal peptidase I [Vibrio chagasii]